MKSALAYTVVGLGLVWSSMVVAEKVHTVNILTATLFTCLLVGGMTSLCVAAVEFEWHYTGRA